MYRKCLQLQVCELRVACDCFTVQTALRTGRGRQGEAVSVATRLQRMVYRAMGDDSLNVEFLPTSCMVRKSHFLATQAAVAYVPMLHLNFVAVTLGLQTML